MRLAMRVLLGLLALAVLLIVAGGVYLLTRSPDRLVAEALQQAGAQYGLNARVAPGGAMTLWPRPGVVVSDVVIEGRDAGFTARADRAVIGLSLVRLILGRNATRILTFEDGSVRIGGAGAAAVDLTGVSGRARLASGGVTLSGNALWDDVPVGLESRVWDVAALQSGAPSRTETTLTIEDAEIAFRGQTTFDATTLTDMKGRLSLAAPMPRRLIERLGGAGLPIPERLRDSTLEATVELAPNALYVVAQSRHQAADRSLSLDVTLEGGTAWQSGGTILVEVVSRSGGLYSAYFEGEGRGLGQITGQIRGAIIDLPRLTGVFDATMSGLGNWQRASFDGDLSLSESGVALSNATVLLDDRPLRGGLAVDLRGDRPLLSASIDEGTLVLPAVETTPIAALHAALRPLDSAVREASVDARLDTVQIGPVRAAAVDAGLTLSDGTADLVLREADLFGGAVAGRIEMGLLAGAEVTGQVRFANVDAGPVLALAGYPLITGRADGDITARMPGPLARLEASAVEGTLSVTDGVLQLADLGAVARGRTPENSATPFQRLSARIATQDGALLLDPLRLEGGVTLTGPVRVPWTGRDVTARLSDRSGAGTVEIRGALDDLQAGPAAPTPVAGEPSAGIAQPTAPATQEPAEASVPRLPIDTSGAGPAESPLPRRRPPR